MARIQYIHTAEDARFTDFTTIHSCNIPSLILMEHAAIESYNIIQKHITNHSRICIICGPGNNGGDGLAIARLFAQNYMFPSVFIPAIGNMSTDEKIQYEMLKNYNVLITNDINIIKNEIHYSDILIDCIFGSGLSRDIVGDYKELIDSMNQSNAKTFSIDIPSGIHATSGKKLNCAIHADYTIALDCFKLGYFQNDGLEYCGKLKCVDIGILDTIHQKMNNPIYYLDEDLAKSLLPIRQNLSHKGTFKKGLMIGGSESMHGAVRLAATSCYRSGIGTLTLMIPDCIGDIIAKEMNFAMNLRKPAIHGFFTIPDSESLLKEIDPFQIICIGNGIGRNQASIDYVKTILKTDKPVIIDADAIWALNHCMEALDRIAPIILTPHIKEMSFLTNKSVKSILDHPYDCAMQFVNEHPNCIVVLKSSTTFIVSAKESYVLHNPNSALAKGGSGDILCGIVMGMCAQTNDYVKACAVASYIHSKSADIKKDPASLLPDDCINHISDILKQLRKD